MCAWKRRRIEIRVAAGYAVLTRDSDASLKLPSRGHSVSVDVQEMAGAGDFRAAPTKVISRSLTFRYGITLKEDREPLFILRHQRWLPATSASLIQKIRERVLILACVPRQLHHNSLVFFHQELEIMSR